MAASEKRPKAMKAVIYHKWGGPEVVEYSENVAVPSLQSYEDVLVKVHAASINPVDYKIREGRLALMVSGEWPKIPGFDFSGKVVAVGKNVTRFKVGDEVLGMSHFRRFGTCAEYHAIPESGLALKPSNLTHVEAATLPLVGLTVWQSLIEYAKLLPGQSVLILGGAGGTGSFAIQLAKHHLSAGRVITTCSGRNAEFVKSLGADEVIDYTKEKWHEVLKGQKLDCILDCVGGPDNPYELSIPVVKSGFEGGSFVTIAPGDQKTGFSSARGLLVFAKDFVSNKMSSMFGSPCFYPVSCKVIPEQLVAISQLATDGKVKPQVTKVFPLRETVDALRLNEEGRTRGKIVVQVVPDETSSSSSSSSTTTTTTTSEETR